MSSAIDKLKEIIKAAKNNKCSIRLGVNAGSLEKKILEEGNTISREKLKKLLSYRPRIEKVAIKDAKLRTFITDDSSRDELVKHVYDVTYGSIKNTDNLVIINLY